MQQGCDASSRLVKSGDIMFMWTESKISLVMFLMIDELRLIMIANIHIDFEK